MTQHLTDRQNQILEFIQSYQVEYQMTPTQSDIAKAFKINVNAAKDHLKALERKEVIRLHPGKARSIQVLIASPEELPLIGSVAAGVPIEAIENVERMVPIPEGLFTRGPTYLLKVRGESMKDIGILDGDMIAVKKTSQAENNQIVVARIDDEVTVKRLNIRGNKISLLPENKDFEPIVIAANELVIEGVFVGLIRDVA